MASKALPVEEVRVIRDEVKTRVQHLIELENFGQSKDIGV
jgi:hypothetical protein